MIIFKRENVGTSVSNYGEIFATREPREGKARFEREAEEKHEQPSRHEESIKPAEWFRAAECN